MFTMDITPSSARIRGARLGVQPQPLNAMIDFPNAIGAPP